MSTVGKAPKNKSQVLDESGYAYVMVLAAVVVLAILAEVGYELTSYAVKHDREEELLFRGLSYMHAIQDYYQSSPPGTVPAYPRNLTDLLSDPRYLSPKRHIRMLYKDPMGGDWNLVRSPDGGISGVVSQSKEKPIKQGNFPSGLSSFEGTQHYSDWVFLFQPGVTTTAPTNGTAAATPQN